MSLLLEIRNAATDSKHSLTDALRKGLVLASLLRNDDLRTWLKKELEGYADYLSVPKYRIISASVYGNLQDGYGRTIKNARYPTDSYPDEVRQKVNMVHMSRGVRELENLMGGDEFICLTLPHDTPLPCPFVGFHAIQLWHQFHRSAIEQVLDCIRTQLLELVLDLRERFPEMNKDEEAIAKASRTEVAAVVQIHINGNQNVVAAGSDITQNVQQIQRGDIEALMRVLEGVGVPKDSLASLRTAISQDGKPSDEKLGPRVRKWLGAMTEKFAEGVVGVAPGVLIEYIKGHYGLK